MTHCSLIALRLLTKMQDLNLSSKALLTPLSLLTNPSKTSRYSPHRHNSVLVAFLDLFRLSLPFSVNQSNILALNKDLHKATSTLATVPRMVHLPDYRTHLDESESRHRPPTTSI